MGFSRKKKTTTPHPRHEGWDCGNSRVREGKRLWKSRREGVELEKVF